MFPTGPYAPHASEPTADADSELWDGRGSHAADAGERHHITNPNYKGCIVSRKNRVTEPFVRR